MHEGVRRMGEEGDRGGSTKEGRVEGLILAQKQLGQSEVMES